MTSPEIAPRTILIVEDDPALALGLVDTLEFEGFRVLHAKSGRTGVDLAKRETPDCIILDLMLPDINGYQVCAEVREANARVPIVMLTARSQEADKIRGLDSGADDYVTKPFSVGELVARLRAIFRRLDGAGTADAQLPFRVGESTVDPVAQTVSNRKGSHALSFYEVQLLRLLHERAGQAVTREEILEKVWGSASSNRTVDNFVVKLRRKVEPQPDKPTHIRTVYGIGYKLVL